MSYDSVVGGKLKLKGRALDVSGTKKKKKKHRSEGYVPPVVSHRLDEGEEGQEQEQEQQHHQEHLEEDEDGHRQSSAADDFRTAAEKRYYEQKTKLDEARLAKVASKSHRQRVEEFNQYLANLSEHYDIPKVGPG